MDKSAVLQAVLPAVEECRAEARSLFVTHPGASATDLAEIAARTARRRGTTLDALTRGPSPAAFVDFIGVLKMEARLAGVIAAIVAPEDLAHEDAFHADILAIMFPSAVDAALGSVGVRAGHETAKDVIRKYVRKDMLAHFAAKHLGTKVAQSMLITPSVPWNWLGVRMTGRRALAYHRNQALELLNAA